MGKKEDMVVNGGLSTTPKTRQAALYYVSVFILWNQRNKCSLCLKQRDKRRVKKPRSERTKIKLNFAGFAIVAFQRLLKFIQSGTWRCSRVPAGIRWSYGGEPRCGWYKGTFKNSKASLPPTVASSKAVTANSIVVSTIWWQRTGVGCILKSDVYGGSPVYDALLVWHSEFLSYALVQSKIWNASLLAVLSYFTEVGHIYGQMGGGGGGAYLRK